MNRNFTLLFSLFLILIAQGCRKDYRPLTFWPHVNARADRLTDSLDTYAWLNEKAPYAASMLNSLALMAEDYPELRPQVEFYSAVLGYVSEPRERADTIFSSLLQRTDSAEHPYMWAKLKLLCRSEGLTERYVSALNLVDYFEDLGDSLMAARCYVELANVAGECGNLEMSCEYSENVLRLFGRYGMRDRGLLMNMRYPWLLYMRGDTAAALRESEHLLALTAAGSGYIYRSDALRNHYLITADESCLIQARELLRTHGQTDTESYIILTSMLANHRLLDGDTASAMELSAQAVDALRQNHSAKTRASVHEVASRVAEAAGMYESAYRHLNESSKLTDSVRARIDRYAMANSEARHNHYIARRNAAEQHARERTVWIFFILGLVIVGLLIYVSLLVRGKRLLREKESMAREMQQNRMIIAAKSLAVTETRNFKKKVADFVDGLVDSKDLSGQGVGALSSFVKLDRSEDGDWDSFLDIFKNAAPDFMNALQKNYPGLSEYNRRLAVFIHCGVSGSNLAHMMKVKPQSINQARWRLRRQLGVPEGLSLEQFLRDLGSR